MKIKVPKGGKVQMFLQGTFVEDKCYAVFNKEGYLVNLFEDEDENIIDTTLIKWIK